MAAGGEYNPLAQSEQAIKDRSITNPPGSLMHKYFTVHVFLWIALIASLCVNAAFLHGLSPCTPPTKPTLSKYGPSSLVSSIPLF
jgi:hypothetical protein